MYTLTPRQLQDLARYIFFFRADNDMVSAQRFELFSDLGLADNVDGLYPTGLGDLDGNHATGAIRPVLDEVLTRLDSAFMELPTAKRRSRVRMTYAK